jgi:hypothetical protein
MLGRTRLAHLETVGKPAQPQVHYVIVPLPNRTPHPLDFPEPYYSFALLV